MIVQLKKKLLFLFWIEKLGEGPRGIAGLWECYWYSDQNRRGKFSRN